MKNIIAFIALILLIISCSEAPTPSKITISDNKCMSYQARVLDIKSSLKYYSSNLDTAEYRRNIILFSKNRNYKITKLSFTEVTKNSCIVNMNYLIK